MNKVNENELQIPLSFYNESYSKVVNNASGVLGSEIDIWDEYIIRCSLYLKYLKTDSIRIGSLEDYSICKRRKRNGELSGDGFDLICSNKELLFKLDQYEIIISGNATYLKIFTELNIDKLSNLIIYGAPYMIYLGDFRHKNYEDLNGLTLPAGDPLGYHYEPRLTSRENLIFKKSPNFDVEYLKSVGFNHDLIDKFMSEIGTNIDKIIDNYYQNKIL